VSSRIQFIANNENVNLTENGKKALLKLSKGDMRRALNILQACHAAYGLIDQDQIYKCTGNPRPEDIERIYTWLMNDEFTTAYSSKC
jgi:replication factor C subunit 3/5